MEAQILYGTKGWIDRWMVLDGWNGGMGEKNKYHPCSVGLGVSVPFGIHVTRGRWAQNWDCTAPHWADSD